MSIDLEKQSLATLKEWAHLLGIRGMSTARKPELIDLFKRVGDKRIEYAMSLAAAKNGGEAPVEKKKRGRPKKSETEARAQKAAPVQAQPTEAPEQKRRSPGRGGFGSYAPSYRAQTEAAEGQEARPRPSRYEILPDKPPRTRPEEERQERIQPASEEKNNYPDALAGPAGTGILEVMQEGYGFIRCDNYMPGENDIYVSPAQIHRFGLKTGDILSGVTKIKTGTEKFPALLYINSVNGESPETVRARKPFEELTPVFPHERIHLETQPEARAMRIVDLMAPIGKGQRGMIVSPPKAGKTTLIKDVAKAVTKNHPDMRLIILLIDERPEEVTDIKEDIEGPNVEVIYSTFDETPEHHKRVAEMVLGRAQRLVEHGRDVIILLDSITRLSRAYNLTVAPSGRTLSGGLDPAALHMPKKFFGSARCMREGGSLTVLATALVDTGSRMDDVVYEEFKGTGNMELVLDRKLSERRIFPAVDILKSGTRRDDLLLLPEEQETVAYIRQAISNPVKGEEALEKVLDLMRHTRTNREFCALVRKMRF